MRRLKKLSFIILAAAVIGLTAILFFACDKNAQTSSYTIEYISQTGGSITGTSIQTVKHGENGTQVVAVPDTGYEFVKWSDGKTEAERTDYNITENKSYTAEFKKKTYTITYIAQKGGNITGTLVQTVKHGESCTQIVAIPDYGYEFVKWSDGKTEAKRTDSNISKNKTIIAEFRKKTYAVEYSALDGGNITGTLVQTVKHGDNCTQVVAVPDIGYEFVKWSDGKTEAKRTDSNITENITYTAEFRFLFAGGEGDSDNPFLIDSYKQFLSIKKYPYNCYKLTSDLDLTNIEHIQLFTDRKAAFNGEFDGDGHSIKNLSVDNGLNYPSLFGIIGVYAYVHDLNIENYSVVARDYDTSNEQYCVGSLAGLSMGGIIIDVNVSGIINGSNLYHDLVAIGGFVGWNCARIERCNANVVINISDIERKYNTNKYYPYAFGGFAGIATAAEMFDCVITAEINLNDSMDSQEPCSANIGGLIGVYFDDGNIEIERSIENVHTIVNITNNMPEVIGGFISQIDHNNKCSITNIINCSSEGQINSLAKVGGFMFEVYGDVRILNCYSKCSISVPQSRVAGFIYEAQGVSMQGCYYQGEIQNPKGFAVGFCYMALKTMMYQCYADIKMTAGYAFGFIHSVAENNIDQCYCTGEITVFIQAVGFIYGIHSSSIRNSYTDVKIDASLIEKAAIRIYSFVGSVMKNSAIENCCIYCDVIGDAAKVDLAIIAKNTDSSLDNCHIFQNQYYDLDNLIINENNNADHSWFTLYENLSDMKYLSNILNTEGDEIWIDTDDNVTKLKYQITGKNI